MPVHPIFQPLLDAIGGSGVEKATPRPWAVDPDGDWIHSVADDAPNGDIVCDMPAEGDESRSLWPANAALIVRAVNSFDDMLAALKAVRDQTIARQHDMETRLNDIFDIALAAIAKAEGASP